MQRHLIRRRRLLPPKLRRQNPAESLRTVNSRKNELLKPRAPTTRAVQ
jgi:hypothetical protein